MVARCEVGSSPLSIRLNPARSVPWLDEALQNNRRTFPPSLGAKYRGLWKTCQENFASEPQNIRFGVPKTSIGSGTYAADTKPTIRIADASKLVDLRACADSPKTCTV